MKLCDFGFAKIDQGDLMTPQFTPYYVAPQVSISVSATGCVTRLSIDKFLLFDSTSECVLPMGRGEVSFRNLQSA